MKLECLETGSPDCPLVRLYEFEMPEALQLHGSIQRLANGVRDSVVLHREIGLEAIGDCLLTLRLSQRDLGMVRKESTTFECVLTSYSWSTMAMLVWPFCHPESRGGYQWLMGKGDARLLLSRDGLW